MATGSADPTRQSIVIMRPLDHGQLGRNLGRELGPKLGPQLGPADLSDFRALPDAPVAQDLPGNLTGRLPTHSLGRDTVRLPSDSTPAWAYSGVMAVDPIELNPELRSVVERARRAAEEAGELRPPAIGPLRSTIPAEAREAIMGLLRDGTYAAAVARVAAEDADLADE